MSSKLADQQREGNEGSDRGEYAGAHENEQGMDDPIGEPSFEAHDVFRHMFKIHYSGFSAS